MRQSLSLVAAREERLVGHVLVAPHQMCLLGQTVPVVNLAPPRHRPVLPTAGDRERLIAAGHGVAAAKVLTGPEKE